MRLVTVLLVVFLAGCGAVESATTPPPTHRPGLLDTVTFNEAAWIVYDEAFTVAFQQGYQIVYSSRDELLLEFELPSPSRILGTEWVHRLGILVREHDGLALLYTRYQSIDPDDGSMRVSPGDREIAEAFLETLKQRLTISSES